MNTILLILGFQLTVGVPEIVIALIVALVLGFSISFFWNSRKNINIQQVREPDSINENDNWKLKYYNDMDMQERAQQQLRERLAETRENEQILNIEVEELRKEIKELDERLSEKPVAAPIADYNQAPKTIQESADYLAQLRTAQVNLLEHNSTVNRLVEQIENLKESETKYDNLSREKEELEAQFADIQKKFTDKENEVSQVRQQLRLGEEMNDRLKKAYAEFSVIQDKLQKLQTNLSQSQKPSDYEQLHESYFKLTKDFDEARQKHTAIWEENQRLSRILSDTEDKLREANFLRVQLQKKVSFLEELNTDLQQVSEHNKKLDSQLRRISEMEALLSRSGQTQVRPNPDYRTEEGK
jgi:chromosome segregation ATPase